MTDMSTIPVFMEQRVVGTIRVEQSDLIMSLSPEVLTLLTDMIGIDRLYGVRIEPILLPGFPSVP